MVQNESTDDIWDDRLLIAAYEQAIQLQSSDIAKSIANGTNKKPSSSQAIPISSMSTDSEAEEMRTFKTGDFVRATYDADNIDYEAEIKSIDEDAGNCVVRFIGYDNEQTVRLVDLVDSWGEQERQKQDVEAAEVEESNDESGECAYPKEIYRNHGLCTNSLPTPPMPPLPPSLQESLGEESEHFSAMLMSWYMSGYYTGLYQGHKLATQQKNKKSLKRK